LRAARRVVELVRRRPRRTVLPAEISTRRPRVELAAGITAVVAAATLPVELTAAGRLRRAELAARILAATARRRTELPIIEPLSTALRPELTVTTARTESAIVKTFRAGFAGVRTRAAIIPAVAIARKVVHRAGRTHRLKRVELLARDRAIAVSVQI
jgi:ribosomal protein S7